MAEAGRYRLSPLAQADLEDIWSYTALRWSPIQAESYHATIIGAFEGLAAGRKQGRSADIRAGYLNIGLDRTSSSTASPKRASTSCACSTKGWM